MVSAITGSSSAGAVSLKPRYCRICEDQCTQIDKRCSGCRTAIYCGRACQKNDWKNGHKQQCPETAKEYADKKFDRYRLKTDQIRSNLIVLNHRMSDQKQRFQTSMRNPIQSIGPCKAIESLCKLRLELLEQNRTEIEKILRLQDEGFGGIQEEQYDILRCRLEETKKEINEFDSYMNLL